LDGIEGTDEAELAEIELDGVSEELFCFEIDSENPMQVKKLHVQLPDDSWLAWNPASVAWTPDVQPEDCALVSARQATEFAAWQYDQEHGGSITEPVSEGQLLAAIQSAEFSSGFAKIFSLVAPAPLSDAETRPQISFDDRDAIQINEVPIVADAVTGLPEDDQYTAEERSKNAKKQVRDKFGRFATAQARVALPGKDGKGTIKKIDPDRQTVEVAGDDGKIYDLPADQVQVLDEPVPNKIDVSQIEAQPRATGRTPKAFLPYTLPPMDKDALTGVVNGYQKFIEAERAAEEQKRKAKEKLGRAAEEPRK
jgi:hypothetical protein